MRFTTEVANIRDVMQVCRNGHVITDLLHSYPQRGLLHCDRCGAQTLEHCLTCGAGIPGAIPVPDLPTAGSCAPPNYCATCGAAFPWSNGPRLPAVNVPGQLEHLLRRLPLIIRQLRWRQTDRPPFRVEDGRDLDDLLRALLPLYFDDIRLEGRSPRYAAGNRTDFLLFPQQVVITAKLASPDLREAQISEQFQEDTAHCRQLSCGRLIVFVYDPEGLLREPAVLERAWSSRQDDLDVRCIIAAHPLTTTSPTQ
jgi:hypothetical protein